MRCRIFGHKWNDYAVKKESGKYPAHQCKRCQKVEWAIPPEEQAAREGAGKE